MDVASSSHLPASSPRVEVRLRPTRSISRQIVVQTAVFAGIAALAVLGLVMTITVTTLQGVRIVFDASKTDAAVTFDQFFLDLKTSLLIAADALPRTDNLNAVLGAIQVHNRAAYYLVLLDLDGTVITQRTTPGTPPPDTLFDPAWLSVPPRFGEVLLNRPHVANDLLQMDMVTLVNDEVGLPFALLVAHIDLTTLYNTVAQTRIGETGYAYIVDDADQIIAYRDQPLTQMSATLADRIGQNAAAIQRDGVALYTGLSGAWVVGSARPLTEVPWYAIVEQPATEALRLTLVIVVLLLALVAALALLLVRGIGSIQRYLAAPLRTLTEAVTVIEATQQPQMVTTPRPDDEIGVLATSFNSMANQIRGLIDSLEQQVRERTADLEIVAGVSAQASRILNVETMLEEVVEIAQRQLSLYNMSVFLYDDETQTLSLKHAGSVALTRAGRRFAIDDRGVVPQSARTRDAVAVEDITLSSFHVYNPYLPETRSELAVPMLVGDRLIGVLDMQSAQVGHFSIASVIVFKTLADQMAVAIRNAQLFEEAQQARQRAERSDQVKSAFLASMSHELRTPLNAIINFSKFVMRGVMGPVTERQNETLTKVVNSGQHLLTLINDILDMSKIESGSLNLFVEDNIDLNGLMDSAIENAAVLLVGKPVRLETDIQPNLPPMLGDRKRILQIVLNILSNACKFTTSGVIRVDAYTEAGDLHIAVRDTGPGIAPEDYADVFESFKQTRTGLRQGAGTGLGMPISRSLAEAHGGRLWFESEVGKGTTFYVTLPLREPSLIPLMA